MSRNSCTCERVHEHEHAIPTNTMALKQDTPKARKRDRAGTRPVLFAVLLVSSVLFPFFSIGAKLQTSKSDMSLPSQNPFQCPREWSVVRCQRRQIEFRQQLTANERIHNEMIAKAQERSIRDVYFRQNPQRWKRDLDSNLQKVKQAVAAESEYLAWTNFSHNSFADLSIVGFPKAGTSHLYKLLVSNSGTQPVFKRKEFCIDHNFFLDYTLPRYLENPSTLKELHEKLFRYHKQLLKKRTERVEGPSGYPLLVNVCLQPEELDYHAAYAPMPPSSKFLLLFRDPADWLWASWNFWIDKNLDNHPPLEHDWASTGIHYRSPELFHELILSQEATRTSGKRFRSMREQTVHVPRRLIHLLGKERLLFIKNEDMTDTPFPLNSNGVDTFLHRLSEFTGLSQELFDTSVAHGRTNCNAQKGFQNLCNATSSNGVTGGSSGYEITQFRPMLEETRQLIYIQFWEECKIWAEEFDVVYEACLQAIPK